ncbi:MAG TPA: dTDP-glucose 4,6-dehydratase, partial [Flavobacteriaceae bacterium]|nr:dTDP-glucose 4,6-dehydratase [Flavobacteriaceae bacterium]
MRNAKSILVTGAAGFIGSNYVNHYVSGSSAHWVVLDKLTYAGSLENLSSLEGLSNYTFVQGDICDKDLLKGLFEQHQFDTVVHFAAESHVDNSITGPRAFVETNLLGSFELLHAAYELWMEGPNALKSAFAHARFLHVSTDEVYG